MNTSQNNELNASSPTSTDNMEDSWIPKIKRRRRFTVDESKVLEHEFEKNSSPNQEKIQRIANKISTPRKIVTTWFQNRRAKNKRKEKLLREERLTNQTRSIGFQEDNYTTIFSSHVEDVDSTSDEEDTCKIKYENDSESDHDTVSSGCHKDQHNFLATTQQHSSISIENYNTETDQSISNTLITQPFHAINNYVLTALHHPNTASLNAFHPPNGQQYNINIYNNMNNHFVSQEHIYGNSFEVPAIRLNNGSFNHQNFLSMIYCQQQISPFYMNINPPPLQLLSNENDSFCINPNDLSLNHFPQARYQPLYQEQQQQLQLREDFHEDSD